MYIKRIHINQTLEKQEAAQLITKLFFLSI